MKLAVLGTGLRTPLLLRGLVRRQGSLPLDQIALYDADPERLATMGALARHALEQWGGRFSLQVAASAREAISGAQYVFTAIRVGQEPARILDEQVPLKRQVLGQETTGPGGFAMALRTVPVMLDYARQVAELAPGAWMINFTNPSGLITQALRDQGYSRVIGICDEPGMLKRALMRFMGVPGDRMRIDYFGLNHLGWIKGVQVDGQDRLPELLRRYEEMQASHQAWRLFSPELIRWLGMLPNEYLYYWYYREQAVQNIRSSGSTRGEQLLKLNLPLWQELRRRLDQGDAPGAMAAYEAGLLARERSYMAREGGAAAARTPGEVDEAEVFEGEGYEGIALAIMSALSLRQKVTLTLNVPNQGVIPFLAPGDVVEVPCLLDEHGPMPLAVGEVPALSRALLEPVKAYERLAAAAAVTGSYPAAVQALTVHPLVASYSLAKEIVDEYLQVHAGYLPQFQ